MNGRGSDLRQMYACWSPGTTSLHDDVYDETKPHGRLNLRADLQISAFPTELCITSSNVHKPLASEKSAGLVESST